jgi:hypothetical protein
MSAVNYPPNIEHDLVVAIDIECNTAEYTAVKDLQA